jgi:predicted DNA-binding protein (UPF0251 family)/DNA-directed RNA polymerase subunit RPC12/RpoP
MARPTKWRKIAHIPSIPYFVPAEEGIAELPENVLKLEELEAIRLKDLEGLDQSECAEQMEVSRPTFQRILLSAREKIADSLVNGKMIHVEGGNFTQNICPVRCLNCGKEWRDRIEKLDTLDDSDYLCPDCGSPKVTCGKPCRGKFGRGNCWRHRGQEEE